MPEKLQLLIPFIYSESPRAPSNNVDYMLQGPESVIKFTFYMEYNYPPLPEHRRLLS